MTDKSLGRFYALAQEFWSQLPPQARFRPLEDAKTFARHKEAMRSWVDAVVQGFYNTLFAHPATRAIFREGERPAREKTLRDWYLRTVEGPFNGQYFAWQTLVGLVHVRRGVTNAMMAAMWNWVVDTVSRLARQTLPQGEAEALADAWRRLGFTVMALISESYLHAYLEALAQAEGVEVGMFLQRAQEEGARMLRNLSPS
ncbi:globin [Thermus scotoductus]|uniref:Globin n=1 Tax=Thermus scotoductus TaxID=37636 RepID=A0A430S5P2_THESC|nr:protoglobin domain-containing protein [Thermus scotoductus]RTG93474.1 globin [Thermus scotoductus]RTH06570.1 globin [Thermus scotoductus]RTH08542.1 globin [Thermus scotoductus]RTH09469.1 globin [Thermus scotoductus]RTH20432.1 globin [Thermus scotoductus]